MSFDAQIERRAPQKKEPEGHVKTPKRRDLTEGFRIPFKKGSIHEHIQSALTGKKAEMAKKMKR